MGSENKRRRLLPCPGRSALSLRSPAANKCRNLASLSLFFRRRDGVEDFLRPYITTDVRRYCGFRKCLLVFPLLPDAAALFYRGRNSAERAVPMEMHSRRSRLRRARVR